MRFSRIQRSNSLVSALTDQEGVQEPLRLRTGQIISVDKASTPWVAEVRLGDNVDIPGVKMMGWYDPMVGDVVQLLQQGPQLVIMGAFEPGKVYIPPAPPPPPPTPAPPTPAPPALRVVNITALDSASWRASSNAWTNDFIQGGSSSNWRRAFWFYGNQIQEARNGGTITSASIFVRRTGSGGVYQGANVRLGLHNLTSRGNGSSPMSQVAVVGQLNKEQGATFSLTQGHLNGLNQGVVGIGLEAGQLSFTSPDYLVGYGRQSGEWSGQLSLTIQD